MADPAPSEILAFATPVKFRAWLAKNHAKSDGLWVRLFKKDSGEKSMTQDEALDEVLCQGWIDAQKRSYDERSWIQRYTPRRARSGWSKINTGHVERLIKEGRMQPAGLKQIEAAKADGRWEAAYDSPKNAKPPEDFLKELAKHKKASAFFTTLNKANVYAIVYRLQTAKKPETRERRMVAILEMLKKGEKFH